MKFSILIPVYNSQKYVDACLGTLTKMCDHEIVVVDDGSKDETGAICDKCEIIIMWWCKVLMREEKTKTFYEGK